MPGFELHPRMQADCHAVGRFGLSHVLLHRNAGLPWFILVPEVDAEVRELYQLEPPQRRMLDAEIDALARYLKQAQAVTKINVAAIGNIVPQLHVHVVGRYPGDPCWPGVVWGNLPPGPEWPAARLEDIAAAVASLRPGS